MAVMEELWEEARYAELNLTSQNVRDKAASFEKTMGNVMETVTSTMGQRDQELQESERNQDSEERENIYVMANGVGTRFLTRKVKSLRKGLYIVGYQRHNDKYCFRLPCRSSQRTHKGTNDNHV